MFTNFNFFAYLKLLILIGITSPFILNAQVVVNGTVIHSLGNSIIFVQTDSLLIESDGYFQQEGLLVIDKDLVVNDGKIDVDGTVDINENLLNNDSVVGLSNSSLIQLNGNWINNSIFIPGLNTTELDGAQQDITGTNNTTFFNLSGLGTLLDIKRLVDVNASVLNTLDLTDVEFATDENNLSVYNTAQNAIVRNDGFVSSLDTGKLERATNASVPYLFPTGSSVGVVRYRPIELNPVNATLDTFGVRLANLEATNEGFDVLSLGDSLCAVNPNFYHRIYGNAPADITMFYIPQEDGEWDAMAQWQNANDWDKLPNEMSGVSGQFTTMTISNWSDYTNPAFALGLQTPFLDLADEIQIEQGESANLNPIYLGPNPDGIMWFPLENIDCGNCLETTVSPELTTLYNLEIAVTQNCVVTDSILIIVNPAGLFLPTAFSPNNDGANDEFRPLNDNLESYNISIYNRWGELVYRSDDFLEGWDGIYKGQNAGIGVYTYSAEYRFENQTENKSFSGNVTLIR